MRYGLGALAAGVVLGFAVGRRAGRALPAWVDLPLGDDGEIVEECPMCDDGFTWYADGTITLCVTCGGKLYVPHSHD